MNKFESILFDYGRYVFVSVFRKAQEEERYEDCAVMRDIMQKYHIPCDTSLEDWRTDLWRCGYSGDIGKRTDQKKIRYGGDYHKGFGRVQGTGRMDKKNRESG